MKVTIQWGVPKKRFVSQPIPKDADEVVIVLSEASEVVNWYGIGGKKVLKKGVVFSWDMTLEG